ncbi:MAG: transaldolase [Actinobacteria bacterium]|nr:transaldolase [Actinomycetota bacterium]
MAKSNLHGLADAGVSIWSDQISRRMLDEGELERRIEEDGIRGVTSNPTIFEKAIAGTDDYDEELAELRSAGLDTEEIAKRLMTEDIQRACDALARVHQESEGLDGYVSVEVSPDLAADTEATVAEARDWVKRINRPNLLVKVPATPEGIPAIRSLIGEGISINVTLTFSLERYGEVMDAYVSGLQHFYENGGDPGTVFSVASFFVSRFDTEVDRRLEEIGTPEALDLRGTTAIANARVAYERFLHEFASTGFGRLASKGGRPQFPLWASTSTKNPDYSDLLYVESLVAPHTVNTMPLETIDAYQDHGDPEPQPFTPADMAEAKETLDRLEEAGVDYDDVVDTLEREGVEKFAASWQELLDGIEQEGRA